MKSFLTILHLLSSLGLIGLITIQSKGSGLGSAFGGSTPYHSKKGVEKIIFYSTITLATLFLLTSLASVFLPLN